MTPDETAGPGEGADRDPGDPGTAPVRAALAALGPARMPDDVAARIRARLAEEVGAAPPDPPAEPPTPPRPNPPAARPPTPHRVPPAAPGRIRYLRTRAGSPQPARRRPGRPARAGLALLAAAVAAVLVTLPLTTADQPPGPVPAGTTGSLADELRTAAGSAGAPEGPLADPGRRRACLAATGVADPDAPLVAARPYPVAGRPGVLLVLGTPERGRFRLVVVDPGCGPGRGALLAELPAGP